MTTHPLIFQPAHPLTHLTGPQLPFCADPRSPKADSGSDILGCWLFLPSLAGGVLGRRILAC